MTSQLAWLAGQNDQVQSRIASALNQSERNEFAYHWELQARSSQLAPPGDWRIWLILAGRGFGKTRAGADWVRLLAEKIGTSAVLLDHRLTVLDSGVVPSVQGTRIAAIGLSDEEPVYADLHNVGLSRRPLSPVHPKHTIKPDGTIEFCWIRRARGDWRWEDFRDVAFVEERESYRVGFGSTETPYVQWTVEAPRFELTTADQSVLVSANGSAPLWVSQVGTFGASKALKLLDLF